MMKTAAAFAHRAPTLGFLQLSLQDPSILPCNGSLRPQHIRNQNCIDGMKYFNVLDPAAPSEDDPSAVIASVLSMDRNDAKEIIKLGGEVFPSWKETTCTYRSKKLNEWSASIQEHKSDIATIMTKETGKPFAESLGEVNYATSFLDFYAGECLRPTALGGGTMYPTPFSQPNSNGVTPRGKLMTIQEAVGVTTMITPWNFPLAMITRKVGPALAAGCVAIVKPSELTPLSALVVKELADRVGIPKGVFELITASHETTSEVGKEFCENPIVKKISFTGSTRVGKLLMKQSSDTVKRVGLELGGNAPFIVFADADIDQAVNAACDSKFRNAGQTCVCADRFLIHKSIEEEFISKLVTRVSKIKVGSGLTDKVSLGPLITTNAAHAVKSKIENAVSDGGECIYGGSFLSDLGANFLEPTIVRNVKRSSSLWNTETFGPVIAISTFETDEEAVEIANDTSSGLASYVCSTNLKRVFQISGSLENGIVGVNEGIISTALAPFGGVKESGLGREGSICGMEEFLETKYIFLNVD